MAVKAARATEEKEGGEDWQQVVAHQKVEMEEKEEQMVRLQKKLMTAEETLGIQDKAIQDVQNIKTKLEQAEAAGLRPQHGCRMGICSTCTCRKTAGVVRNLQTGELSSESDEQIRICISQPVGSVTLEL